MNKVGINFFPLALFSIVSSGCAPPVGQEKGGGGAVVAVHKSVTYANRDWVDGSVYAVTLVAISANGHTHALDRMPRDEYHLSILRKLAGREYWEVCYGSSDRRIVASTYCYYLDSSSYELIVKYHVE